MAKFVDEFKGRVVSGVRRRRELDDRHQSCCCGDAHLVDREKRVEMAIADEGLRKRYGRGGLLILVDVGKLEGAISGDGECTPHEGKFTKGEDELELKSRRVAVIDNRTQDVDDEVE
jgi:hypothetical protein